MPRLRMLRRAKAQCVEASDRPRPHRKDIAKDATDAGGGTLIRLDVARMVVALHLETHTAWPSPISITPAFSPGPWITHGALGRQPLEMDARGFVRAVLVPHRREDAELGECRHPPDQLQNALIFVRLQAVRCDEFGGDLGLVHQASNTENAPAGKGLLWRNFRLSIDLRACDPPDAFAHRRWIGFKSLNTSNKGQIAWTT